MFKKKCKFIIYYKISNELAELDLANPIMLFKNSNIDIQSAILQRRILMAKIDKGIRTSMTYTRDT